MKGGKGLHFREKLELTYGIYSSFNGRLTLGVFMYSI